MGRLFYPKPFIESDAQLTLPQRKDTPECEFSGGVLKGRSPPYRYTIEMCESIVYWTQNPWMRYLRRNHFPVAFSLPNWKDGFTLQIVHHEFRVFLSGSRLISCYSPFSLCKMRLTMN
uniref:Uncharacterized protein n=1 Tax=Candidatus Kentrum sp. FM TaxID=2126340 RepID=A0A450WYH7_9GAMM|nr:MAG: hypothetical protein BECKFM1743C_GA0114222_106142 [Candidatus Kentron sp. FM]VFJ76213.1 MAG: hypothetical protein BECKFM1743A_GA0114220_109121 [Candidatus Kentron sp. FM]VFK22081.1 MAG: hypothetical protein BECKFM1743B_GA0114221_108382 [Candidatus Kentron sp. FM]